jgi:hypothetical protein
MGPLLLLACAAPEETREDDGFLGPTEVRLLAPVNGETVPPVFTVSYETGSDVSYVRFFAAAQGQGPPDRPVDGVGELEVSLEDGRYNCALVGYDRAGVEVAQHDLTLRVEGGSDAWVTIVNPADGATVPNPVSFVVDASEGVERVDLYANDTAVGSAKVDGLATFTLDLGDATITAIGVADGAEVARDTITVEVTEGTTPAPSEWNAYVLDVIATYPTDGSYGYYWPEDDGVWFGTTRDVWYQDTLMSPGDRQHRSFCVGLTWEVLLRVFDEVVGGEGTFNGMTVEDMEEFRTDWFVRDLYGDGVVSASRPARRSSRWSGRRPRSGGCARRPRAPQRRGACRRRPRSARPAPGSSSRRGAARAGPRPRRGPCP